jgi:mediator of RNA polymerase II transcription subunit 31
MTSSSTPSSLEYYKSLLPENREDQFYIDLEFLQNLCNARYLHYLAQNGYFQKEEFMKYLKYLRYWKEPQYMKYILFPQCLAFLDAVIDNVEFRSELTIQQFIEYIHVQQGTHWVAGRSIPYFGKGLIEEVSASSANEGTTQNSLL